MNPITYISEQDKDYAKALGKCNTLEQLKEVINDYKELAYDAFLSIPKNENEFKEFLKGAKKERKGIFSGEEFIEKYGDILMPKILFLTSHIAIQYKVPWGLAFIRLKESGKIKTDSNGVAHWVDKLESKDA